MRFLQTSRLLLFTATFSLACSNALGIDSEDLYGLLGVSNKATIQEIKAAYRKKALETHPDKRKDVTPEQAAEEFLQVVHAFEILSDDRSRLKYDGNTDPRNWQQKHTASNHRAQWHPHRSVPRNFEMKVRDAMSHILYLQSLRQLQTFMLDENGLLERHLLICFVTHAGQEHEIATSQVLYPYPFGGMSEGGIFWESLLQTTKVAYNRQNDLTRYFQIPTGSNLQEMGKPIFVFGKRGEPLSRDLPRLQTDNNDEFQQWVWGKLKVKVEFINNHDHPVEIYWVHAGINETSKGKYQAHVEAGGVLLLETQLSHEFWVKDTRVNTHASSQNAPLAPETLIGIYNIVSDLDQPIPILIEQKQCFDFSGFCPDWKLQGRCNGPDEDLMDELCPFSCRICSDEHDGFRLHGFYNNQQHGRSLKDLDEL